MFAITFPRHGAILNANHGREDADSLHITVTGLYDGNGCVKVNGVTAQLDGATFRAEITLSATVSTITAIASGSSGRQMAELEVIWDRCSFKRCNFFIEDNSFFLTELAAQRPASIFDHFYLGFLKQMHRKYGIVMTLKCFFRNDHDPAKFNLTQMPECWKSEFEDNSDWLKLAFHAPSEFPDRTCQDTAPETMEEQFNAVNREILRFAGEKTLTLPTEIHWCMLSPAAVSRLASLGVKCLDGHFLRTQPDVNGDFCDLGYCLERPECQYLCDNLVWHDFSSGVTFTKNSAVCNLLTVQQIPDAIRKAAGNRSNIISISSHEQYIFPFYRNYQSDHFQRMEAAFRTLNELGVRPVFFNDGFMGNPATVLKRQA